MSDTITTPGGSAPAGRTKPLFTAHRPTWHWAAIAGVGGVIVVIGLVTALQDALSGRPDALEMAGFSVFFFCGFGVLWLLAAAMVRRSRIDGFDQYLSVVSGFRKPRTVQPGDIGRLGLEVQSRNGVSFQTVVGWDQRGRRRLVRATRGHPGTDEVEAWLASRCPKEWAALG